jgi:DNA primase (bacterial type)
MTDTLSEAWEFLDCYDDDKRREKMLEMLLDGEKVVELIKEAVKLQGEIIALRNGENEKHGISEDEIERARQYPFENLIEFKRNMTRCPFHEDREPSMHLYREQNRVHCFSCNRSWDTIQFLRERDGLTFREAVRRLCE